MKIDERTTVLREYKPAECDERGIPLGWEGCRECRGGGKLVTVSEFVGESGTTYDCPTCEGHGSLKAAVLAEYVFGVHPESTRRREVPRCESCNHSMSDGEWELHGADPDQAAVAIERAQRSLQSGQEPAISGTHGPLITHFSRCDERCEHGGPLRMMSSEGWRPMDPKVTAGVLGDLAKADGYQSVIEASWRIVEVRVGLEAARTMGKTVDPSNPLHVRPWDLRRENVALLCTRCWAEVAS